MPRLRTETFTPGDQSWLGSTHGIANARTETVDVSTFTAGTHYPDGFIKSGYPVAKVAGLLVPYNSGGTGGTNLLAGHLLTDVQVIGTADVPAPLLDHGRVKTALVPQAGFAAPIAANVANNIQYI